jgi:hypothetical protein
MTSSNVDRLSKLDGLLDALQLAAEYDLEQSLTHAQRNGIAAYMLWVIDKARRETDGFKINADDLMRFLDSAEMPF